MDEFFDRLYDIHGSRLREQIEEVLCAALGSYSI